MCNSVRDQGGALGGGAGIGRRDPPTKVYFLFSLYGYGGA